MYKVFSSSQKGHINGILDWSTVKNRSGANGIYLKKKRDQEDIINLVIFYYKKTRS